MEMIAAMVRQSPAFMMNFAAFARYIAGLAFLPPHGGGTQRSLKSNKLSSNRDLRRAYSSLGEQRLSQLRPTPLGDTVSACCIGRFIALAFILRASSLQHEVLFWSRQGSPVVAMLRSSRPSRLFSFLPAYDRKT
ncbi:hypothetical protein [Rhizobium hainanense]|uniref:hypothetical protein n=1 Tax=Rhizobium hainanense TaxID=52131 RepID=UPI00117BB7E2|nr:hypothetical protein [Rhizobium hainanense]